MENKFIINIHKASVKSEPNNYRGITLVSCLGKLFLSIINNRLVEYLNIKLSIVNINLGLERNTVQQIVFT